MISLMLTTGNQREAQILQMAFKQRGIEVVHFRPNYQNYVKMLQYLPDVLIMEFPRVCSDQLHFVKLIRSHKQTKKIPIIGYGERMDPAIKKGILAHGADHFMERPLKFTQVMAVIGSALKRLNKSLDSISKQTAKSDRDSDMALLKDAGTLPIKKIEIMVNYVAQFLAFPFTVAKVLNLTQDERAGAGDLAKVIETDPVISANILKVSNTVFFASLNRRIGSIKDAIVRIGFEETKKIVVSMSVMDLFDAEDKNFGFNRIDFWYHSLATGLIAERLAKRMGGVPPEEAFLAGLLHDFGIIVLDEFFPELFAEILEATADHGGLFIDRETAMLGVHHNDVVNELFSSWKMPVTVIEAVTNQYDFYKSGEKLESAGQKLALCVGVGNVLAKTVFIGRECDQFVRPIDGWIFRATKLLTGFSDNFLEDLDRDIALYRQFLGLDDRDFLQRVDGIDQAEEKEIAFVNQACDIFPLPLPYLKKEELRVTKLELEEKASTYDQKFDLIVVWAGNDASVEAIDKYASIVKRGVDPAAMDGPPPLAPVLVLQQSGMKLHESPKLTGVSFMPHTFDLRKLDQNIIEILMGKQITYVEYEAHVADVSGLAEELAAAGAQAPDSPADRTVNTGAPKAKPIPGAQ